MTATDAPVTAQVTPAVSSTPAAAPGASKEQGAAPETTAATPAPAATPPKALTATPPPGAPKDYAFKAPEGATYPPSVLKAFGEAARGANLTQEHAQAILDAGLKSVAEHNNAEFAKAVETAQAAVKADKEFGAGDEQKFKESMALVHRALADSRIATPELKAFFEQDPVGLLAGSNVHVLRLLARVGKLISPDGIVTGAPATAPKTHAQRIFGNAPAHAVQ